MNTADLLHWANVESGGTVDVRPDYLHSIGSNLLRFRWRDGLAIGVGSEALSHVRINAILDGLALLLESPDLAEAPLHLVLGVDETQSTTGTFDEQFDAIGTLVDQIRRHTVKVQVWKLLPDQKLEILDAQAPEFTSAAATRWSKLLMRVSSTPVGGMAADLVNMVDDSSLALYPKLSSLDSPTPWQVRLDGVEIGRVGSNGLTLSMNSRNLNAGGEPREWV